MNKWLVPILAGSTVCLTGSAPGVEFKPEIRICAEASGTFVKGGACWIYDLNKGGAVYEYQFCVGLIVDGGVLIAGAQGQIMLCGTLTVPVELADKQAWKGVAKERFQSYLVNPANRETLRQALKKEFTKVEVRDVKEADADTASQNRTAVKNAKRP